MNFNDVLRFEGIDPETVIAFRHRPKESGLRRILPWLASERGDLFNAYQQIQGDVRLERAMESLVGKGHVAAFIGQASGEATFAGLYRIAGAKPLTRGELMKLPVYQQLQKLVEETRNWFTTELATERSTMQFFALQATDFYAHWKGRLVVDWPPPERSWWRRAHRNNLSIRAIHEQSVFDAAMPAWDELNLSWEELRLLPRSWKIKMSQWRGIYYIYDVSIGKGYVGSAYGDNNLIGRWENYAATGHGENKLLRRLDPVNFRFSILQRVSPDMEASRIVRLETRWKERLHTHAPQGLNDN